MEIELDQGKEATRDLDDLKVYRSTFQQYWTIQNRV